MAEGRGEPMGAARGKEAPAGPGGRGWAEAAFAAVAAVALYAAGSTLRFPFNPAVLVCPVPLVLVAIRHGAALGGTVVALAGGVLAAAQMPGGSAMGFVLFCGLPALALGLCMRRSLSPEWTVALGAAALCAAFVLGLAVWGGGIGGVGPAFRQVAAGVDGWLLEGERVLEGLGSAGDLAGFPETLAGLRVLARRALPGLLGAGALLLAATLSALAMGLAARTVGSAPPPFAWALPEGLVWAFIGAGGATLAPWGPWRTIGLNALVVLLCLYLLQGLAIAGFFFRRLELPRSLRYLAAILAGVWPPLTVFVVAVLIGVGLCDVWVAFRRLDASRPS